MNKLIRLKSLFPIFLLALALPLLVIAVETQQSTRTKATGVKAQIFIDTANTPNPLPQTWKALAQGGEEKDVRMLQNVTDKITELGPRYIRIDHIYDFYNIVSKDINGNIVYSWQDLDNTVCDILQSGAKPFLVLGYMPEVLAKNGSLIDVPKDWNQWSILVQKTIERYSGQDSKICGNELDNNLDAVYYEVWNEPDLETFGKWSIYDGQKDYKTLYYFSSIGAQNAANARSFFLGGPVTTRLYSSWLKFFLDYAKAFNLRVDFISWHHYSKSPDDFSNDMQNIKLWLSDPKYEKFANLPLIISEWGYDSDVNPDAETELAAAHAIASIRSLVEQNLEMAFTFDIKDGPNPRWGILTHDGAEKPRYRALKLLNKLGKTRLFVTGEGTWVKTIATKNFQTTTAILVNYDPDNINSELVPVTFTHLTPGRYFFTQTDLNSNYLNSQEEVGTDGILIKKVYLPANSVFSLELTKI